MSLIFAALRDRSHWLLFIVRLSSFRPFLFVLFFSICLLLVFLLLLWSASSFFAFLSPWYGWLCVKKSVSLLPFASSVVFFLRCGFFWNVSSSPLIFGFFCHGSFGVFLSPFIFVSDLLTFLCSSSWTLREIEPNFLWLHLFCPQRKIDTNLVSHYFPPG